ncbi:MAG TPA: hypothetical protein ENI85_11680, partial [Deltaproteobacteria bacterium]|nr:hypothetical protein [Deltaproteobacteria bacterium]
MAIPIDPSVAVIRVLLVASGDLEDGAPAPMRVDTTAALARLGDPVELLRVEDPEALRARIEDPSIDVVLLDRLGADETTALLERIASVGPPTVVVIEEDSEEAALAAFRAGASDCVRFGPDHERVLPIVLLEQVRRWRADRQRRLAEMRIRDLENLNAAIVSEMPAALVVIDADGLIVTENAEFGRLFPSRSASSPGSEFLAARLPAALFDATDPDLRQGGDGLAGRAQRGARLVRVEGAEGAARAFEVRLRALQDAGRLLILISDVTESEWLSE